MTKARGQTVAERMDACHGFTSGFDYLRLFLALSVLTYHSFGIVCGVEAAYKTWMGPWRSLVGCVLPIFFALSGFLVAASLERTRKLTTFMTYRALRIVPALAVEVTLSALLIGPVLTSLPLREYFSHPDTWSYFYNIIGHIHYFLPGVFEGNPRPQVNISLWTIPYELECYIALFLLAVTGLVRRRLFLAVSLVILMYVSMLGHRFFEIGADLIRPPGLSLVGSFLAGVVFYQWREKIVLNAKIFLLCALVMPVFMVSAEGSFLGVFFAAYVAVYLGTFNPPKREFFVQGDYSYGIYLFAFPVQQLCVYLFPQYNNILFNIGFSIVGSFLCAYVSWHLIEMQVLKKKKEIAGRVQVLVDAVSVKLKAVTSRR